MQKWPKVVIVELARNHTLVTAGGGTGWTYQEMPADAVRNIGPWLEQITCHHNTKSRTTNVEWKVVFYWSYDGDSWEGPFDVVSAISADGQDVGSPYTTQAEFGLHMRYALGYRASTGSAVESATVSATLVFQTLS